VLSDVWGPEISAGWSAYVDDLHGDSALGVSESFVTSYAISAGANAAGNYYNCGTSCADSTGWFSYTQGSFAAEDADALYNGGGIFPAFDDLSADIYFAGDFAETTVVQSALANKKSLFGDAKRFFGIGGN
jgi:hypothetical protein